MFLQLLIISLIILPQSCSRNKNTSTNLSSSKSYTTQQEERVPSVSVKAILPKRGDIASYIPLTANVLPYLEVTVSPKISGKIEALFADEGSKVEKGMLICKLEDSDYLLQVKQLEAALEVAKTNYEHNEQELNRMRELLNQGAISIQQYQQIETAYKVSSAQLTQAKAALDLAREQLEKTKIYSPLSGHVSKKLVEVGEIVSPQVPLFKIVDLSNVKIEVAVPEEHITKVKHGQSVEIQLDAYPNRIFTGKITEISPTVDRIARTFQVKIIVPNQGALIKPGMFARVRIITERHKNVLLVPVSAVINRNDKEIVFVVSENGIAREREVKTGISDENYIEIISGIKSDEKVIIEGNYTLTDGAHIREI